MRTVKRFFRGIGLAPFLAMLVLGASAQTRNSVDMAIPVPTASDAPPARVTPDLPESSLPSSGDTATPSAGGNQAPTQFGNDAIPNAIPVEVRELPDTSESLRGPPAPSTSALAPRTENGVTWLCGGVGLDEANQMKQEARKHALMLTFAARDGSYLADVNLSLADNRGQRLLQTMCTAPIMLLDPGKPGTYRITAETGGATITRSVTVSPGQHGKSVVLVWPSASGADQGDLSGPSR